jgi:hypothetical protein
MTSGTQNDTGDELFTTILFWISMPLAFGLGMWCCYALLQRTGPQEGTALSRVRATLADVRQDRRRVEGRLRRSTDKVSALRTKLSRAKRTIEELKSGKRKDGKTTEKLKQQVRNMRDELEELRRVNQTLQKRLTEVSRKQQSAETSESQPTESAGGADVPGLEIVSADADVTERNSTFWQYSWTVKLKNNGPKKLRLMGEVLFNSGDGGRVSGSPLDLRLAPDESKTVSGDCLIRSSRAENVQQLSVTVSEIPEARQ